MPYKSVADLPPAVKKLSDKKQHQWMSAFNSCYESRKKSDPEEKCFKIAWAAVGGSSSDHAEEYELFPLLHDPTALGTLTFTPPADFSVAEGDWVEVFRAGDYGDKGKYTESDLDSIVANYDPAHHEAPACVGHPAHNKPAVGWVEGLRHVTGVLYAKFKQLNPKFLELLQSGAFKKRSISLYTQPRLMLRHIGFLGAMPPEVKGLADPAFDDAGHPYQEILFEEEKGKMDLTLQNIKDAFADAIKSVFPGGQPPKQFSEDDVNKLVTKATEKMAADLTKVQTDFAAFVAANTSDKTDAQLTAAVDLTVAGLKAKNKYLPAFDEMRLPTIFRELAASKTEVTFGEGDKAVKKSPLQVLADFLDKLPEIVPTGNLTRAANRAATSGPVKFNEASTGQQVVGVELANAAAAVATRDKISYGEALTKIRRGEVTVPGAAVAGKT